MIETLHELIEDSEKLKSRRKLALILRPKLILELCVRVGDIEDV